MQDRNQTNGEHSQGFTPEFIQHLNRYGTDYTKYSTSMTADQLQASYEEYLRFKTQYVRPGAESRINKILAISRGPVRGFRGHVVLDGGRRVQTILDLREDDYRLPFLLKDLEFRNKQQLGYIRELYENLIVNGAITGDFLEDDMAFESEDVSYGKFLNGEFWKRQRAANESKNGDSKEVVLNEDVVNVKAISEKAKDDSKDDIVNTDQIKGKRISIKIKRTSIRKDDEINETSLNEEVKVAGEETIKENDSSIQVNDMERNDEKKEGDKIQVELMDDSSSESFSSIDEEQGWKGYTLSNENTEDYNSSDESIEFRDRFNKSESTSRSCEISAVENYESSDEERSTSDENMSDRSSGHNIDGINYNIDVNNHDIDDINHNNVNLSSDHNNVNLLSDHNNVNLLSESENITQMDNKNNKEITGNLADNVKQTGLENNSREESKSQPCLVEEKPLNEGVLSLYEVFMSQGGNKGIKRKKTSILSSTTREGSLRFIEQSGNQALNEDQSNVLELCFGNELKDEQNSYLSRSLDEHENQQMEISEEPQIQPENSSNAIKSDRLNNQETSVIEEAIQPVPSKLDDVNVIEITATQPAKEELKAMHGTEKDTTMAQKIKSRYAKDIEVYHMEIEEIKKKLEKEEDVLMKKHLEKQLLETRRALSDVLSRVGSIE